MLTSIRKIQQGTLIVLTVVICIAFAMWLGSTQTSGLSGNALTVYGRQYRASDLRPLANRFQLAQDLGLGQFAFTLLGNRFDLDRTDFVINLLVLENEARRLGIEPSNSEVQEFIQQLPRFLNESGQFDPAEFQTYLRNELGRLSLAEADVVALVSDVLKFRGLMELIGSGMEPTPWEVTEQYRQTYEQFTAYEVLFKQENFSQNVEIKEDAIKAYYEDNQQTLTSEEKRSIGYLRFPLPESKEGDDPEAKTTARAEVAKQFNQVVKRLNEMTEAAEAKEETVDFSAAATQLQNEKLAPFTIHSTEPFALSAPPEELKGQDDLVNKALDPRITEVVANQFGFAETDQALYLFWLKEIVKPQPLSLEEAKPKIEEILRTQEINQRLNAAVAAAQEKIKAEMEKGSTFEAAAKAAGVEAVALKPFSASERAEGSEHAFMVQGVASELTAGQFGPPQDVPGGVLLVYLAKRELPKRESEPEDRARIAAQLESQIQGMSFFEWLSNRAQAAEPKWLTVRMEDGTTRPISVEEALNAMYR